MKYFGTMLLFVFALGFVLLTLLCERPKEAKAKERASRLSFYLNGKEVKAKSIGVRWGNGNSFFCNEEGFADLAVGPDALAVDKYEHHYSINNNSVDIQMRFKVAEPVFVKGVRLRKQVE